MKSSNLSVFCLIIAVFLSSCNSHPTAKSNGDSSAAVSADSAGRKTPTDPEALTIDSRLLQKYRETARGDTGTWSRSFYPTFFDLVKEFNGRRLDTTVLTIGNIDGDDVADTIFTRIYYMPDSIYVDSKWIKGNKLMWQYTYTDPFDDRAVALYGDTNRNVWAAFVIGVLNGAPDFHPREELDTNMMYQQGMDDLNGMGIRIDREQYKAYLKEFKGDLLAIGNPESRERLWIWYKPAGRLITYYQP